MANKNRKAAKNGNMNRRVRVRTIKRVGFSPNPAVSNHWRMLVDPCFAPLYESAYRGRSGIVSRFTSLVTLTGSSSTGFLGVFNPESGAYTIEGFTDPTVPTGAFGYGNPMPGQGFITQAAEAVRVIGCCIDVDYIGTELERSGMIYGGVVLGDTVGLGAAPIPDSLKQLLPNQTRTPDKQLTQLWFPGVENELYANNGSSSTAYNSAHNSIAIMGEGLPAGIKIRLRITSILEWLPLLGVGISMPSPVSGHNPVGAYEKLHEAAAASNMFTHSFTNGAYDAANRLAYRAGQALLGAATQGVARTVARRMGMGPNANYGNLQLLD